MHMHVLTISLADYKCVHQGFYPNPLMMMEHDLDRVEKQAKSSGTEIHGPLASVHHLFACVNQLNQDVTKICPLQAISSHD